MWGRRGALWIPWATRKTNKQVVDQIKPELSLEVKITRLKQTYFGYVVRRYYLKKIIMFGKVEGSIKRGRPNMR